MTPARAGATLIALIGLGALTGCGAAVRAPDNADRIFLRDMISHHERAIAVARIGIDRAQDPRVRTFARRIVSEQTPELHRMRARARDEHLGLDPAASATMARNRITDREVAALRQTHGRDFDVHFLSLHIVSEQGAASMARTELAEGHDPVSRAIAEPIATAPSTEIPQLRHLRATLG